MRKERNKSEEGKQQYKKGKKGIVFLCIFSGILYFTVCHSENIIFLPQPKKKGDKYSTGTARYGLR